MAIVEYAPTPLTLSGANCTSTPDVATESIAALPSSPAWIDSAEYALRKFDVLRRLRNLKEQEGNKSDYIEKLRLEKSEGLQREQELNMRIHTAAAKLKRASLARTRFQGDLLACKKENRKLNRNVEAFPEVQQKVLDLGEKIQSESRKHDKTVQKYESEAAVLKREVARLNENAQHTNKALAEVREAAAEPLATIKKQEDAWRAHCQSMKQDQMKLEAQHMRTHRRFALDQYRRVSKRLELVMANLETEKERSKILDELNDDLERSNTQLLDEKEGAVSRNGDLKLSLNSRNAELAYELKTEQGTNTQLKKTLETRNKELEDAKKRGDDDLDSAKGKLAKAEGRANAAETECDGLKRDLDTANKKAKDAEERADTAEASKISLENDLDTANKKAGDAETKNTRLNTELDAAKQTAEDAEAESKRLQSDLNNANATSHTNSIEATKRTEELELCSISLQTQLDAAKQTGEDAEAESKRIQSDLDNANAIARADKIEATKRITELESSSTSLQTQLAAAEQTADNAEAESKRLQTKLETAEATMDANDIEVTKRINDLELSNTSLQSQLDEANSDLKNAQTLANMRIARICGIMAAERATRNNEFEAEGRIAGYQVQINRLQNEVAGLQDKLKNTTNEDKKSGDKLENAINELEDTTEEWRKTCVQNTDLGREKYAESARADRLEERETQLKLNLASEKECTNAALKQGKIDLKELETRLNKEHTAAIKAEREKNDLHKRDVQGERDREKLAQKYKVSELEISLCDSEKEVQKLTTKCEEYAQSIAENDDLLDEKDTKIRELTGTNNMLEELRERYKGEVEGLEKDVAELEEKKQELEDEAGESQDTVTELEARIEELEERVQELEEELGVDTDMG